MRQQIFLLYACDERKGSDTLIYAGTSEQKFVKVVENEIRNKNMFYSDSEVFTAEEQIKKFKKDWKTMTRGYINNNLTYGYYDYTDNDTMI